MKNMNNLTVIEQNDQKVLTTEQLAMVYGTSRENIVNNINRNKDKFIEGKHYFILRGTELKEFKGSYPKDMNLKYTSQLYLWTERGASRHCKILDTDNAWEQFDNLEDTYFKAKSLAHQQFQIPENLSQALRLAADQAEQIEIMIPKVEMFDQFLDAKGCSSLGTVAKTLGLGRNTLFKILRKKGIIMQTSTTPYQKYIDAGYFKVIQKVTTFGKYNEQTMVTPKGQVFIAEQIKGPLAAR